LRDVVPGLETGFTTRYDFGDGWEHGLLIEAPSRRNRHHLPSMLNWTPYLPTQELRRRPGYEDLLEIIADPAGDKHQERLECLGLDSTNQFHPVTVDIAAVNAALSDLAKASNTARP
ncbi:hypothetical protein ACFXKJ_41370, partial [Kitasatospora indigofera]